MSFRISVKGEAALKARMKASARQYQHAFAGAFYQVAGQIMRKSIRLVPRDFGFLGQSHFVTAPHLTKDTRFGYGTNYAVPVHEKQAKHAGITQWHFLSDPYDEMLPSIKKRIAGFTQKNFKNGFTIRSVRKDYPTKPKPEPPPEKMKALRKRRNAKNKRARRKSNR